MQIHGDQGNYRIQIDLLKNGATLQTENASFRFNISALDQERIRWYFEDYLQYPEDPSSVIARQVEKFITEMGKDLFNKIFMATDDARNLWIKARPYLNDTHIEIVTHIQEATSIPWELICDPIADKPLALSARSFMRTCHEAEAFPELPNTSQGPIRILLAICRPGKEEYVPFRSVAGRIVRVLSTMDSSSFQLDVLRPPTFAQLKHVLRTAREQNRQYHLLHFDGHGDYIEQRGWISFEYPNPDEDGEIVNGDRLGGVMRDFGVPVLVLNACRSAYAESPNEPIQKDESSEMRVHSRVQAFGSLAQEVANQGVVGVVAMRYVVYAATASKFIADFYDALVQGLTLGDAVSQGRKKLYDQPMRKIAFGLQEIHDWSVPVVYGSESLVLFPRQEREDKSVIKKEAGDITSQGWVDQALPPSPNSGFFGMDETIHAIDRAFDSQRVVLLHGLAGSGKTATAAEFARWYSLTGGVKGPILFTSFERYIALPHVLDKIGLVFRKELEHQGIRWLAIDDVEKRDIALKILRQEPVLWIWDNVEPVSGFPSGNKSIWTEAEQNELVDFLKLTRDTQAKFLLTSRRDEEAWLGEIPRRVAIRPMHILEMVELARAKMNKHGYKIVEVGSWMPLLEYAQGNPLTITMLVGQALRENLSTKEQIKKHVEMLRAGETEIQDDERLGRSKSLGASLSYGFQHAFDDFEREIIALLYFFQGFVHVDVLMCILDPGTPWHIKDLRSPTREEVIKLLNRANEVGLLKVLDGCYCSVHPALPWYFKKLFDHYYKGRENEAVKAFVEAVSSFGEYLFKEYSNGNRGAISFLAVEESNLLYAIQLALKNDLWGQAVSAMTGIRILYEYEGRWMEWKRLVEEIEPFYLDPYTGGPIAGRENGWNVVSNSKIRLAWESRQFDKAQGLLPNYLKWSYMQAEKYLINGPKELDEVGQATIMNYIVSLEESGHIQREMNNSECIRNYQKSFEVRKRFGIKDKSGILSRNIATAYLQVPGIQDLEKAERWCRTSIKLTDKFDPIGRGKSFQLAGQIQLERIRKIGVSGKEPEQKLIYKAQRCLDKALDTFPEDSLIDLATTHNSIGNLYGIKKDYISALEHYREAIQYIDALGDPYKAAFYRLNSAFVLYDARILPEAKEFAQYALKQFQEYGKFAAEDAQKAQNLLELIEKDLMSAWNVHLGCYRRNER